ncbi:MAG: PEP/pyruvate-binding domain-containing protein [Candidatus Micrarchaeota archaeon]|nr:PEP/pyruvate-binding domain-containing protein [Candidatus Micrarchaeota archaeon]
MRILPVKSARFEDYFSKMHASGTKVRLPNMKVYPDGLDAIGGKAENLMRFRSALLENTSLLHERLGDSVLFACPKATVIGISVFEKFMKENGLTSWAHLSISDDELAGKFMEGKFSEEQREIFRRILAHHTRPIALRSSALNEDAERYNFAGMYLTVFLPNCHPSMQVRLAQFEAALKLVYASTYFEKVKKYRRMMGLKTQEAMACLVMNVAGRNWQAKQKGETLYHPLLAFAGLSKDEEAMRHRGERPEDGCVTMCAGLGPGTVEGERGFSFSFNLGKPWPVPIYDAEQLKRSGPNKMYVLPLSPQNESVPKKGDEFLSKIYLQDHGQPEVYAPHCVYLHDGRITEYRREPSSPVMIFMDLLKPKNSVFLETLRSVMEVLRNYYGMEIEFEGAADRGIWDGRDCWLFYALQVRPIPRSRERLLDALPQLDESCVLARFWQTEGGCQSGLYHLLYVKPESFAAGKTYEIASEIDGLNRKLSQLGQRAAYVLVTQGRWCTKDSTLGVPGRFETASNARLIVEQLGSIEKSGAIHDYQAFRSAGVTFAHIREGAEIDLGKAQAFASGRKEGKNTILYSFEKPLSLAVDNDGNSVLYKPE